MLLRSLTLSNHKYYVAIFWETDTCYQNEAILLSLWVLNDISIKMFLSLSNFLKVFFKFCVFKSYVSNSLIRHPRVCTVTGKYLQLNATFLNSLTDWICFSMLIFCEHMYFHFMNWCNVCFYLFKLLFWDQLCSKMSYLNGLIPSWTDASCDFMWPFWE